MAALNPLTGRALDIGLEPETRSLLLFLSLAIYSLDMERFNQFFSEFIGAWRMARTIESVAKWRSYSSSFPCE